MRGIRVLDFGIWRPVPYATALLAELGAEVTKVEPPGGDPMRGYPDLFAGLTHDKTCITIDLKTDEGRAHALTLATDADIVTEGFRAGVAERLGIGYDDIAARNPDVVYCSIRDAVAGHDINYQAASGILALSVRDGAAPLTPRVPWADLVGGLYAAFRIAAAVATQPRVGVRIEVAMTDVLAAWAATCRPQATGRPPGYGVYPTLDGHVALGVLDEEGLWSATCIALGLDDAAGLSFAERLDRSDELDTRIAAALAAQPRDDAVAALLAAGAPATAVRTVEELA